MTAPKRRGRPPKNTVTIKATPKKRGRPPNTASKEGKELAQVKFMLRIAESDVLRLNNALDHARTEIANLKHKEIGYKALISYFEHQLGLKGTQ